VSSDDGMSRVESRLNKSKEYGNEEENNERRDKRRAHKDVQWWRDNLWNEKERDVKVHCSRSKEKAR